MFVDTLLDWLFGVLKWMLAFLPDVPHMSDVPMVPDTLQLLNRFMDVSAILTAFGVVVNVFGALVVFSGMNWIVNKVRGSG